MRPFAVDLLSLMSFFDRQGIPEALLRTRVDRKNSHSSSKERDEHDIDEEEGGEGDDDRESKRNDDGFEDDMQILRDYSIVSIDTNQTFEMHALVQLATRQ